MPDDLSLRQSPAPLQRLRRSTLLVAALVVVALVGLLAWGKTQVPPVSSWMAREQAPVPAPVSMPESLKAVERPYQELIPKPQPPIATPLPKPPPPPPPVVVPLPPPVQAQADPLPDFLDMMRKQQALSEKVAMQQQVPVTPQGPPPPEPKKPVRQAWRIKPQDIAINKRDTEKGEASKAEQKAIARKGEAEKLITPAVWAKSAYPWKTLFRSQAVPVVTLDALVSDIPGTVRLQSTVPIFDRFWNQYVIVPKGTIFIASQEGGSPTYGMSRIPLRLEQAEFETGEVLTFKAAIGDSQGATGLKGTVDNHVGKLVLATGLSALLNIGVRAAAGTPGTGSFFQNPAQAAAADVGQSVQRDTASIIDRELRIKPTITVPAGTFATIQLGENLVFNRPAHVVR